MNISDVKEFITLPNGTVKAISKPCEVPPEGWVCSRDRGHDGTCAATSVGNCELGEHCRCKSFDVAYKADCWNWIGKVKL
jgi:hypothetical protein